MLKKEKVIESKKIFDGKIINVRLDTVETYCKKTASREIVEHPDGVGIVAIDENNRVCLVRQYRNPFDDFITEIPAGKAEKGENVKITAIRELSEETGYTAESMSYMGYAMVSPGFCSEKIHLFLARGLKKGECHFDEDEFLEMSMCDFKEAYKMVMDGQITDAKTIIGILKAKEILDIKL